MVREDVIVRVRLAVCILALLLVAEVALGAEQNYPSKVIRIVTAMPGSANDVGARKNE